MRSVLQVFSSSLLAKLLMAVALVLLMRLMPASQWAEYTFAFALVSVMAPTLSLIVNMVFIVGEKQRSERDVTRFFAAQLAVCGLLIAAAAAAWPWQGHLLLATAMLITTSCLSEFMKTCFQQRMHFHGLAIVEFARSVLFVGGIGGLYLWRGNQLLAAEVLAVQAAAMLPLLLPLAVHRIDWRALFHRTEILSVLADLTIGRFRHITGYYLLGTLFGQITVLLMKALATETQLANYGAAFRVYGLLMLTVSAVLVVHLPSMKQASGARQVGEILRQHRRTVPWVTMFVVLGAAATPWLLPWLDGGRYPQAPQLLQLLCIGVICSYAWGPYSNVPLQAGEYRYVFRCMLVFAPLSIGGCGVLLASGGVQAMAAGFVAFQAAWNLWFYAWTKRWLLRQNLSEATIDSPRLAA